MPVQATKKTTAKTPTKKAAASGNAEDAAENESSTASGEGKKVRLLEKMFLDMLRDIYWAEQHLVPTLRNMQTVATTSELQDAFEDHLFATQKHAARLEKVFSLMGEEAQGTKCDAMEGLINEANAIITKTQTGTMTRDAALIIAAQKVEHYEIASYGSLVQIARTIGRKKEADILEKTLWEEEDTDELLTDIAEGYINPMADEE